ncbi:hypothetical protein ACHAXR_001466 [Thalassiosira sp. AJA248-18]
MSVNTARMIASKAAVVATPTLRSSWNAVAAPAVGTNNASLFRRHHPILPTNQNGPYCQQSRNFARNKQRGGHQRNNNNGVRFDKYDFDDVSKHQRQEIKNILVIGSSGVLGKSLVSHFGEKCKWNVMGADVLDPDDEAADGKGLSDYICLPKEGSVADLTGELYRGVSFRMQGGESNKNKFDAIVCASGGWAGDVDMTDMTENHLAEANSSELEDIDLEEEYARESAEVCERMMRVNYYPIVAGSQIGRRFMKRGGLFCIIGASAALSPTPGMLGYGSAKSAAHHYLQSWGPTSWEENDTAAVGILPLMIDTPANRAMLDGDDGDGGDDRYSKMVKPMHIANEIGEWIEQPHLRPHSGSLVKVISKNRRDGSGGAAFHLVR